LTFPLFPSILEEMKEFYLFKVTKGNPWLGKFVQDPDLQQCYNFHGYWSFEAGEMMEAEDFVKKIIGPRTHEQLMISYGGQGPDYTHLNSFDTLTDARNTFPEYFL